MRLRSESGEAAPRIFCRNEADESAVGGLSSNIHCSMHNEAVEKVSSRQFLLFGVVCNYPSRFANRFSISLFANFLKSQNRTSTYSTASTSQCSLACPTAGPALTDDYRPSRQVPITRRRFVAGQVEHVVRRCARRHETNCAKTRGESQRE